MRCSLLALCVVSFIGSLTVSPARAEAPSNDHPRPKSEHAARKPTTATQLHVDRQALAQSLSDDLLRTLALTDAAETTAVVAAVEQALGIGSAERADATPEVQSLSDLLRAHAATLQRALAPVLSQAAYERYVALLDAHAVVAE